MATQRSSITWREASFAASGVVLGAAISALVMTVLQSAGKPQAAAPPTPAAQQAVSAVRPSAPCPLQPAAAKTGGSDGRFQMPEELHKYGPGDAGAFMVIGKEAAAEGRLRDAEIAFLMACRVADRFKGAESVEAANARVQLALHYETLAQLDSAADGAGRSELQRRAQLLRPPGSAASAPALRSAPGPTPGPSPVPATVPAAEKPVQTAIPAEKPLPPKPAVVTEAKPPAPQVQAKPASRRVESPLTRSRPARAVATVVTQHPSFDCRKARSATEKMICSDSQLAQLDRELGWLHTRAKNSARNSWAFRSQSEQEWRRREASCRNRECLVRWYAHRRHQLLDDINSG
jgi:hypothetical protein